MALAPVMVIIDAAWSMPATGRTVVSEVVEQRRGLATKNSEMIEDRDHVRRMLLIEEGPLTATLSPWPRRWS